MSNTLEDFLKGKSEHTRILFEHFVQSFNSVGTVEILPAKTMIGIGNGNKRIVWVTQLGKNFIHVVFPFKQPYADNLCFQKIAQVPGDSKQFNHHLRILFPEDINKEVQAFMKLAYTEERK